MEASPNQRRNQTCFDWSEKFLLMLEMNLMQKFTENSETLEENDNKVEFLVSSEIS